MKLPNIFLATVSVQALCAVLPTVVSAGQADRPNIVFLFTDDQATYSMGCYGNEDVQTPNLDRLAKAGIVFDRHYATTAICMGSRATVMTGMYEYKTGCNFSHGDMMKATWEKSYPMLLRQSGYATAFAGKFGFELKANPGDKHRLPLPADDFDRWGGGPGQTSYETRQNESMAAYAKEFPHSTLSYGAFGRDFIKESATAGKPFCLSISFKAPHKPATPDPRFDDIYDGKKFQKPTNFGRKAGEHFAPQSKTDRQYERFFSWNYADKYDEVMATYHQQVYGVDAAVGMIVDALKKAGVADNTVIIYTSDNGFFCGSHGYGSKVLPYEESSRVPLIVFDPRHKNSHKQLRCKSLTGLIDVAPTILNLAGVSVPSNVDGADLMELYAAPDQASIHEDIALINVWGRHSTHALAIVTKNTKYIYWGHCGNGMSAQEELYDLKNDPLEMVNQAKATEPASTDSLDAMRQRYDQRIAKWKAESVSYNRYEKYGVIFDRHLDWSERRKPLSQKPKINQ